MKRWTRLPRGSRRRAIATGRNRFLPYSYAGTIGVLGYGSMDRRFFHRLGASQLDRTICSEAGGHGVEPGLRQEAGHAHRGFPAGEAGCWRGARTSTATTFTCGRWWRRRGATGRG